MTKGQLILDTVKDHPGRSPAQLARAVHLSADTVSAHCTFLVSQGKLDRVATGRTFHYYPKGQVPPAALNRYVPTADEARRIFERATAGVDHAPGALSVAWDSFISMRGHSREAFLQAVRNYESLARTRPAEAA